VRRTVEDRAVTTRSPIWARPEAVHAQHLPNRSGVVADYIPELAKVEPDLFGIAIAMADGQVYEIGDSRVEFTIQSVSKAFNFRLALRDHGRDELLAKVGVEPTGDPSNSIVLDEEFNRPPNPMVDAGAIAVTGGPTR
jgi:glutaminase